ncbi:helix-turn-helix transcriptional regulator [Paenibacillus planticolens]|uniref:HTH luxR-type domain-containing protein n=1 Tax=Paenibacillus planticolens TaxID=2654976 RepID=A0ABX1ZLC1_9BACL|nr:helix-turn-helix transcriptional regulator [Paenibacillus planticolens]NOV00338.1 hypothetical protein [Paenibacillus planticolens]
MSVFAELNIHPKTWIHYNDLPVIEKSKLGHLVENYEIDVSIVALPKVRSMSEKDSFITLVLEEIGFLSRVVPTTHFFVLANTDGIVIHVEGAEPILDALKRSQIVPGCSFALDSAGINGISLAMHLGCAAVVEGANHSLQMFSDWTCICHPIKVNDQIVGYLDLTMREGIEVSFASVLVERLVDTISEKLNLSDPEVKKESLTKQFEVYKLTSREKEVAHAWLGNQSVLQIACNMGITEGTVRNMLKKVYSKTQVRDKGQYYRKFLI